MILALIRKEFAFRTLFFSLPAAPLIGWLVGEYIRQRPGENLADTEYPLVQSIFASIQLGLFFFVFGQIQFRAHAYQLALPVAARTLWLSRMIAGTSAVMLPALLGAIVLILSKGLPWTGIEVRMIANFLAVFLLFPFLFQMRFTSGHRVDARLTILHWTVFALVAIGSQLAIASLHPPFLAVLTGAVAVAGLLGTATYRSLPKSFELASGLFQGRRKGLRLPAFLRWLERIPIISPFGSLNRMLRPEFLVWLNLFGVLLGSLMFVMTSFAKGMYGNAYGLLLFQVLIMVLATFGLPRVAHLPISKGRVFDQAALQGLIYALIAVGLGLFRNEDIGLLSVWQSPEAAAGVLVYFAAWFVLMAVALMFFHAPALTRRDLWKKRAKQALILLLAIVPAGLAFSLIEETDNSLSAAAIREGIAAWLPEEGFITWPLVAVMAVAAYFGLRAVFMQIEVPRRNLRMMQ